MFKPTMAAVIGLVCVALVAAETGVGILGTAGDAQVPETSRDGVPGGAEPFGGEPSFAYVPASHAAYGWRYSDVFRGGPSPPEQRQSARPLVHPGDGR